MSYSSEVLADSPLVLLMADEASGATAVDSSGNGRDASYVGSITYQQSGPTSQIPHSFSTSGSSSYLALPTLPLGTSQPQTFETWYYAPEEINAAHGAVYLMGTTSTGNTYPMLLGASTGNLTSEVVNIGTTDSGGTFGARTGWVSPLTISAGWHHLVITFNGARNGWRLFIDATEVTSGKVSYAAGGAAGAAGMPSTAVVSIGRYSTAYSAVRTTATAVYDTELSPTRVAAHYDAATTVAPSATLDETFPPLSVDIAAELRPDLDITFPAFRHTGSASVDSAAEVDVTFGSFGAELVGELSGVAAGSVGLAFPLFRSLITAETEDSISTVTAYDLNGRVRGGIAYVSTEVAVEPLPAGLTRAVRVDKALAYPTPTLVDGRPT